MKTSFALVGIERLCKLFGKTRHAFYDKKWYLSKRHSDETIILELLYQIKREVNVLSTRVIYHMIKTTLRNHGITIGRDELHEIRRQHGFIHKRKRKYCRTTDSNHRFRKYPNIIKDLIINRIEQVWVSDITYIRLNDGFSFLSLITDAYSRKIMGYCLHPTLEAQGPLIALRMAISNLSKAPEGLIHHSDRGIQYCCDEFVEELELYCIESSMTENGDPRENAIAERLNGILKKHFGLKKTFSEYEAAKVGVDRAIKGYNDIRPHQSISMFTPTEAHQFDGKLERMWKPKSFKPKI